MTPATPRMTNLFLQLGLEANEAAIARFIEQHQLPTDVDITAAAFWNAGQRQLLCEQLRADASWAIVVDQLNEALHAKASQAAQGQ